MAAQLHSDYPNAFRPEPGENVIQAGQNAGQVQTSYGEQQPVQEGEQERIRREADLMRAERALVFSDKNIRMAFIRKVYSILTMQLVIVALITVLIYHKKEWRVMFETNMVLMIGVFFLLISTMYILVCCQGVARTPPINYILLFLFTVSSGLIVALVAARYRIDVVLIAVGITAAICFLVTIFACQTTIDFTVFGPMLCIILLVFTSVGTILTFFKPDRPFEIIFAGIGVLIFSFILLHDTQLMLGGNHRYAFSPEDYIYAAMNLYLDIINIFLYILEMFSTSSED